MRRLARQSLGLMFSAAVSAIPLAAPEAPLPSATPPARGMGEPSRSPLDSLRTVKEYQAAIRAMEPGRERTLAYYHLFHRIEAGQIPMDGGPALSSFVSYLAARLDDRAEDDDTRTRIAEFLSAHAHPAASDALWRAARADVPNSLRHYARQALVALGDERVLEPLLEEARAYGDPGAATALRLIGEAATALRLIGELGSPRAIGPLEGVLNDPALESRIQASVLSRFSTRRPEGRELRSMVQYELTMYRDAAKRALRDIRFRELTGFTMPFELDDHAHTVLARQGFVILPEAKNELYEHLSSEYPYVSVDIVFHTFMILARASFDDLDRLVLRPRLARFTTGMVRACQDQLRELPRDLEREAATRNLALFAVVDALLNDAEVGPGSYPAPVVAMVKDELRRIRAADGTRESAVWGVNEDFTKYKPRGRHASTPELRSHFQAMLYLGRTLFRIGSERETTRALLLLDVLDLKPELRRLWAEVDGLLALFFGELDDPGVTEYENAIRACVPVLAARPALEVLRDAEKLDAFRSIIRARPAPRILTVAQVSWDPEARSRSRGFRVFGQRYTRAMDLFQQCLEKGVKGGPDGFPSGLHVASALLGSLEAERILQNKAAGSGAGMLVVPAPPADPLSSLSEGYVHCFMTLFERGGRAGGRSASMTSSAWEKRLLNAALGGWAEVTHATMLYAKDANIYMGASGMLDRFHGYVDPYPEFFSRLGALIERLVTTLDACGLFERIAGENDAIRAGQAGLPSGVDGYRAGVERTERTIRATREMFGDLQEIVSRLQAISAQELRGEPQSVADGIFLKGLHLRFKRLAFNWSNSDHHRESMALVSDPATEYLSRLCLQVGVGRALALYVAVPFEGRTYVCRGPIYSYYEFTRSIENRLDDETWRWLSRELGTDPLPWVAEHPELGFGRSVGREELKALGQHRQPDGRASRGGWEPWLADESLVTRWLVTARVDPSDIDLLIALADRDTVDVSARAFALQRLADFGTDPRVLAAFRRQLTAAAGREENHLFHVRLYHTIRGLGSCGRAALPDLDKAEGILRSAGAWQRSDSPTAVGYRKAIDEARRGIAAYPRGRSPGLRAQL